MRKFVFGLCLALFGGALFGGLEAQNVGVGLQSFMKRDANKKMSEEMFAQRYSLSQRNGKEYISLLAKLKEGASKEQVEKLGCRIGSQSGRIVTLKAPTENLDKVVASGLFERIEAARKIGGVEMDNALQDLNADYVQQGLEGLPQGFDGSGVIIGIADWGFDYTHPVFYDTLMQNYRILAAWDQYRSGFAPPEGFDYGAYIEGEENLLAAGCDTNNIYDIGYHGTHVGGIAAGGGAGTKYRGVAYGAELLMATWLIDESGVMDSYAWMRNEAKARGKRLVVNNSWGIYYFGEMDGTSLLDEYIYNMSAEDSVIFVVSAGNNGGSSFHAGFNFANADTLRSKVEFNLPTPASDDYWGQTLTMLADSTDAFSARLELYSPSWELLHASDWFNTANPATHSDFVVYNESDSLIYRVAYGASSSQSRAKMEWEVRLSDYYNNVHVVLAVSSPQGSVHAWNVACLTTGVGNWGMPFVWQGEGYVAGDDEYAIGEPAIGKGVIAVAAHRGVKRNSSSFPQLAYFSSCGPNLCNYLKPEVSAPGVSVVNALSSYTTSDVVSVTSVEFNSKTYGFASLSGTSMSSPAVSGVAALLLQANPELTAEQVKQILVSTARSDNYTGEVPNYKWGYGKVNALSAVKEAARLVGLDCAMAKDNIKVLPNPTESTLYVENLPKDCRQIEICDVWGRQVARFSGANTHLDVANLKSGAYFLNLYLEGKMLSFKFVKL